MEESSSPKKQKDKSLFQMELLPRLPSSACQGLRVDTARPALLITEEEEKLERM